jgi:peptidoglycan/LPS O-acetylase OafA/YrhL
MLGIIILFPIWLFGVALRFIKLPGPLKKGYIAPDFYGFLFLSVFLSITHPCLWSHYLVGVAFGLLILFHQDNPRIGFHLFKKPASFLADFSFSIYAYHLPIMFITLTIFRDWVGLDIRLTNAGPVEWLIYLGLLIGILITIYILYYLTERHTYVFRKWLELKLGVIKKHG